MRQEPQKSDARQHPKVCANDVIRMSPTVAEVVLDLAVDRIGVRVIAYQGNTNDEKDHEDDPPERRPAFQLVDHYCSFASMTAIENVSDASELKELKECGLLRRRPFATPARRARQS